MSLNISFSVVAVALSTAMVGCGGSSSSLPDTDDIAASNSPTEPGAPSAGTFFNADDGIDFASVMGRSLSTISNRAIGSSADAFREASQDDDPTSGVFNDETSVEQCDSGSVSFSIGTNELDELENASIVFNDCVTEGQTATGSMSFTTQTSGTTNTFTVNFDDFGVSGSEGNSSIDGAVSITADDELSGRINGTRMTLVADGETTEFTDFDLISQFSDDGGESVGGQATITSSQAGRITMSINPAFEGESDDENPTSGVLTMTHEDGSSLIIDAGTGDPATFDYIINGGGSVTSGVGNWDDEDLDLAGLFE